MTWYFVFVDQLFEHLQSLEYDQIASRDTEKTEIP